MSRRIPVSDLQESAQTSDAERPAGRLLVAATLALSSIIFALTVVGANLPTSFLWGMNHLAFLSPVARYAFLVCSLLLTAAFMRTPIARAFESVLLFLAEHRLVRIVTLIAAGAGSAMLFYHFRISTDMYGDSRTLLTLLGGKTYTVADVFRLDITDASDVNYREPLTRYIHQVLSRLTHVELKEMFQIVSSVCGGLFIVTWLSFILSAGVGRNRKDLFLILGLTCGANQLFFGHVEDYTLVYLFIVFFLVLGWRVFDTRKGILPAMLAIFIIGTRLHSAMLFFIPAIIYACCYRLQERYGFLKWLVQPRMVLFAVALTLAGGYLTYEYYYQADHQVVGDQKERGAKIFLPVSNNLPAPHSYTMLSADHASDFVQVTMLTVSPGAVVICCLGLFFVRRIRWNNPRVIFFGLGAFYFLLFNFTVNPLLTPERDWDLLSLAAMPVTFFAMALSDEWLNSLRNPGFSRLLTGISIGLALLSSAFFVINSDSSMANRRLRSVGIWAFRSYYLGSAYLINVGAKDIADPASQVQERIRDLEAIEPWKSDHDLEYGFLCHKIGDAAFDRRDYDLSARYYLKSLREDPHNASAIKDLAIISMLTWKFNVAESFMSTYNENVNYPEVVDFKGLLLAEAAQYMNYLVSINADSQRIAADLARLNGETR